MSSTDADASTTYRGPMIPIPMGEQLQRTMGLPDRPDHFGDLIQAWVSIVERDGIEISHEALCTVSDSPHEAVLADRTQHYQCVQDPIFVPFLTDDVDAVNIHTQTPVDGTPIHLTVSKTGIAADPSETLFSFGVQADLEGPPTDADSPILAHQTFCPYGHPFASREEYDRWAAEVDAYTMATTVDTMYEIARTVGEAIR